MIDKNILYPLFLAFAISVALSPFIIPFLQRLKVGQTERKEGVQSHLKKAGTPTMGGLIILISVVVTSLFFIGRFPKMIPVLFLDPWLWYHRFSRRLSEGRAAPLRRPVSEAEDARADHCDGGICRVPVDSGSVELGDSDSVFRREGPERRLGADCSRRSLRSLRSSERSMVSILPTGCDGLATGVTTMAAVFFTAASVTLGAGIEPLTAAVTGALIGFLLFNVYPAKVFMGDTGSLALGGFVAGAAYAMRLPMFILIIGLIYWVEIFSAHDSGYVF